MAYCSNCGAQISNNAVVCPKCGVRVVSKATVVPNHLIVAILTTLFCCLPCGIVALFYATQVNSKLARGDLAGATVASNTARFWIIISLILGIVVALLILGIVVGVPQRILLFCLGFYAGLTGS